MKANSIFSTICTNLHSKYNYTSAGMHYTNSKNLGAEIAERCERPHTEQMIKIFELVDVMCFQMVDEPGTAKQKPKQRQIAGLGIHLVKWDVKIWEQHRASVRLKEPVSIVEVACFERVSDGDTRRLILSSQAGLGLALRAHRDNTRTHSIITS